MVTMGCLFVMRQHHQQSRLLGHHRRQDNFLGVHGDGGFVKVLGLAHVLWVFWVLWIVLERLPLAEKGSKFQLCFWSLVALNSISLFLDVRDIHTYIILAQTEPTLVWKKAACQSRNPWLEGTQAANNLTHIPATDQGGAGPTGAAQPQIDTMIQHSNYHLVHNN
jgi:hypothetical protein